MSNEVVQVLLSIALAVISGGITIATVYLRKRWTSEELAEAMETIDAAVRAAEIMGAALGWDSGAKKAWVIEKVGSLTKIPADELQMFVEAAVARLKAAGEELTRKGSDVVLKP